VANSTHTVLNSHLKVLKIPSWFDSKSFAHLVSECPPTENRMSKEDRGFASMDREKQREIARKGGRAAHEKGTAHEWNTEEARAAGRKGGLSSSARRYEAAKESELRPDLRVEPTSSGSPALSGATPDDF
jgi:general stress protein YciG